MILFPLNVAIRKNKVNAIGNEDHQFYRSADNEACKNGTEDQSGFNNCSHILHSKAAR